MENHEFSSHQFVKDYWGKKAKNPPKVDNACTNTSETHRNEIYDENIPYGMSISPQTVISMEFAGAKH